MPHNFRPNCGLSPYPLTHIFLLFSHLMPLGAKTGAVHLHRFHIWVSPWDFNWVWEYLGSNQGALWYMRKWSINKLIPDFSQMTPASSLWPQLCPPPSVRGHSWSVVSLPVHATSSSKTSPDPSPNWAATAAARASGKPNSRHATRASLISHWSSQTVPHWELIWISTRPSLLDKPSTSRMLDAPEQI